MHINIVYMTEWTDCHVSKSVTAMLCRHQKCPIDKVVIFPSTFNFCVWVGHRIIVVFLPVHFKLVLKKVGKNASSRVHSVWWYSMYYIYLVLFQLVFMQNERGKYNTQPTQCKNLCMNVGQFYSHAGFFLVCVCVCVCVCVFGELSWCLKINVLYAWLQVSVYCVVCQIQFYSVLGGRNNCPCLHLSCTCKVAMTVLNPSVLF